MVERVKAKYREEAAAEVAEARAAARDAEYRMGALVAAQDERARGWADKVGGVVFWLIIIVLGAGIIVSFIGAGVLGAVFLLAILGAMTMANLGFGLSVKDLRRSIANRLHRSFIRYLVPEAADAVTDEANQDADSIGQ